MVCHFVEDGMADIVVRCTSLEADHHNECINISDLDSMNFHCLLNRGNINVVMKLIDAFEKYDPKISYAKHS